MGNVISLPMAGLLCQYGFSEGWDSVFYVIGKWLVLFSVLLFKNKQRGLTK